MKPERTLIHFLCLSGIVALVFYLLHDVIGGMLYPGYDRSSQAVSDLTAISAPSYVVASGLASIYGLFSGLSSALVCIVVQGKGSKTLRLGIYLFAIMNWVSAVGYSLFPLSASGYAGTFQDVMHVYVVTVAVVLLSVISLALIIIGGLRGGARHRSLAAWAIMALTGMVIGGAGTGIVPAAYFGIVERFSTYGAVAFTAVLGVYGFRAFGDPERRPAAGS